MNLSEYQVAAARTMHGLTAELALGLVGEAGEIVELLKKHIFHGHPMDQQKLSKEAGDLLWYLAAIASSFNLSLDDIARQNLEKLQRRYPDGWSEEASINRSTE